MQLRAQFKRILIIFPLHSSDIDKIIIKKTPWVFLGVFLFLKITFPESYLSVMISGMLAKCMDYLESTGKISSELAHDLLIDLFTHSRCKYREAYRTRPIRKNNWYFLDRALGHIQT